MRMVDLFGGMGGFRYGIENAISKQARDCGSEQDIQNRRNSAEPKRRQVTCVLYADIDKYATAVYNYNFKENWKPTDITKLKSEDIPDHDILCGGFPCQAFSIAGKRRGFDDTRGTLFFEIARIIRDKRPKMVFLENVKGLLSHENGRTFATILDTLRQLGYVGQYQVLNSKHFGVPQNRERVFIIGYLRKGCSRQVFPIGQDGETIDELQGQSTNTLTARYDGAQATGSYIIENKFNEEENKSIIIEGCEINQPATIDLYHFKHGEKRPASSRIMDNGNSATISAAQPLSLINNGRIRRLTPTECERLQGYPDGWTKYGLFNGKKTEISNAQRYKMCGNSVTTNVIQAIAEKVVV